MRLTNEELTKLGNTFTALQALAVAGCDTCGGRHVHVIKPDNSFKVYEVDDDTPITLLPGDEVELVPSATTGGPVNNQINS